LADVGVSFLAHWLWLLVPFFKGFRTAVSHLPKIFEEFGSYIDSNSGTAPMYIVARLFLGFGIPFCIVAASSLMGELGYPNERPILTSLFNACWFIGSILAASITYGTQSIPSNWSWRIPSLLQAIPSVFQIVFILYVQFLG
jgi:hypothetical protein